MSAAPEMDSQIFGGRQKNTWGDVRPGVPEVQQNGDRARVQDEGGKGAMEPVQVGW